MAQHRHVRRWTRIAALTAAGALVGATLLVAGAPAGAQKSNAGGEIRFGLEAETPGGFCIPNAQLVVAGIQVAAAVYDTLTAPNTKGEYVPNLAESVTPNATFDQWTIKLRPGIKFHNGEALNADAVVQNIEAWRKGPLFGSVYKNIAGVEKVDDLTVRVTTGTPWAAFPAFLYLQGRAGIAAPAQLADSATCARNLIGTGPFKLNSPDDVRVNESLTVVRNPSYWRTGAKGRALPCLDKITFVPVSDSPTRQAQLEGGQLDIMHTTSAQSISALDDTSGVDLTFDKKGNRETNAYLINTRKAPFNDPEARLALAYAIDTGQINRIRNLGMFDLARSTMDTNSPGYLKNNGFPKPSLKKAQQLVEAVKARNGGQFDVTFLTTDDTEDSAEGQLLVEQVNKAGMNGSLNPVAQSQLVGNLLGGNFSVGIARNFYSDPAFGDISYVWFAKDSLVNFSRIDDPAVQAALDAGRTSTDPDALEQAYEDFNRAMAKGIYNVPSWYTTWALASKGITGQVGAPLPDGSKQLVLNGRFPVDALCKK